MSTMSTTPTVAAVTPVNAVNTSVSGLSSYQNTLYGCRFCPMCKPAGEVPNLTMLESHTTRARAMMLWRIVNGMESWTPRAVEILYQTTLDSISESWCVSHYPVSKYLAAARAEVFAAGLAPQPVREAIERDVPMPTSVKGNVLLLASEIAELGDDPQLPLTVLRQCGVDAVPAVMLSGALAYSLGAHGCARDQATQVAHLIRESGATMVIADGPQTLWALHRIYPALGVALPEGVTITSLSESLARKVGVGLRPANAAYAGKKVFIHDSRASALLADQMAKAEAIQPGFRGSEESLGVGSIYDALRHLLDAMEMQRVYSVWSRSLSKSCGADDGLWLTYPKLAEGLAKQRLQEARRVGAEMLVTDSLLCAAHLTRFADSGIVVRWLPELLEA